MTIQLILIVAALAIAWLIFTWLINVIKTTVQTAVLIAVLVLVLQVGFVISPQQIFNTLVGLPQQLWQMVTGGESDPIPQKLPPPPPVPSRR